MRLLLTLTPAPPPPSFPPFSHTISDYDLAGFSVGAVERNRVLPNFSIMAPGDVLLGIASSGVHSNGFSLVRRIVSQYNFDWLAPPPFASSAARLCDAVLTPTKIYIRCLLPTIKGPAGRLKGMAHITGGGLPDNMPRALRDDVAAHIDARTWPILPVFRWMQSTGGGVDPFEMSRAFNCGIGMVLIVAHDAVDEIMASVRSQGEQIYRIGELKARSADQPQVVISGLEEAFRA